MHMRGLLVVFSVLMISVLSASSFAQSEPQPEVDVDCLYVYGDEILAHPKLSEIQATIECTLNNQNPYQVEVETDLEWIYSESHDESSTVSVNANSEVAVRFDLWVTEDAPAGIQGMTFDATVVQYAGIRECTGCETTSSSLDLKILEWATVDLQQTSQSHAGIFGGDWVTEHCSSGVEYSLNATMTVEANHQNPNTAVGYSTTLGHSVDDEGYWYHSPRNAEQFISKIPSVQMLDAGPGESLDVSAAFSLKEFENQTYEAFIIFIVVYGEENYVNQALQAADIFDFYNDNMVEFHYGGCYVGSEVTEYEYEYEGASPVIIETSSDSSTIYLVAGIGIALAACLAVVLIFVLVRKGKNN
ncbi:MAG: hypothetical protein CM15mP8_2990 [Methanobacteriota archaeon]|nr:MAG: hypothetical protein CM15mP8_2990 [Euryarchaeota archaeon]